MSFSFFSDEHKDGGEKRGQRDHSKYIGQFDVLVVVARRQVVRAGVCVSSQLALLIHEVFHLRVVCVCLFLYPPVYFYPCIQSVTAVVYNMFVQ